MRKEKRPSLQAEADPSHSTWSRNSCRRRPTLLGQAAPGPGNIKAQGLAQHLKDTAISLALNQLVHINQWWASSSRRVYILICPTNAQVGLTFPEEILEKAIWTMILMPPKSMALMNFQSILTFITSLKCDTTLGGGKDQDCCLVAKSCPAFCDLMDCSTHARLPHHSLSPGVCSNSCLLSRWCHPIISSSVGLALCSLNEIEA